jgi:hypothetical protein
VRRNAVTACGTPLFVGSGSAGRAESTALASRCSGPDQLYRGPQRGHGRVQGSHPVPVRTALLIEPDRSHRKELRSVSPKADLSVSQGLP